LYLENGAFAILEPKEFERIKAYIDKNFSKVNVDKLIDKIKKLLSMNNIEYLEVK
jgi:(p)ppGpp synthase/HD superfamily hydrolase